MSTNSNTLSNPASNAASNLSTQTARRITMPHPVTPSGPDGSQIPERTICLVLDIKLPGNSRRVSGAQVQFDADRDSVTVSKRLITAHSFRAVAYFDARLRRWLNAHCLPSLFRGGVFLLPLALVEEVDARLQEFERERQQLVETFLSEYPQLVEEAQRRLRSLFRAEDYPPLESLRGAFALGWRYVALRVPETLAVVDRGIFAREREKAARQWDEAAQTIQALLRANMAQLVQHMTQRLSPDADGTPRIFRDSMVGNMSEFLRNFSARDVTDDVELAALVERARALLDGVDPATLRQSDDLRATVCEGFGEIQRNLDRMITNRPARRIVVNRPTVANSGVAGAAGSSETAEQGADLNNAENPSLSAYPTAAVAVSVM